ncbi:MAG: signal peptide peptidase SppA [Desulfuromonadaceae bacterium]|nr:signal peptide peptidase SppA [Desulfuromonas sp.]MDY0186119.1 signal peptide peptidase SppA [Desulfuromonadaceae bacterium]
MKIKPVIIVPLAFILLFGLFAGLILFVGSKSSGNKGFSRTDKIGVIEVIGPITQSKQIIADLKSFERNTKVKAVVLRVDSPGGGVGPSQEIYAAVKALKNKPVIVSMGSVAASGGYYIAAPATHIFANPGTITGSIGVIMEFPDIAALLEKIGLHRRVIKSGTFKDIGSPVRDMTSEEQALLQGVIDDVYAQFVAAVAIGRDLEPAVVRKLADGRIFSGSQAKEAGLVDELGGLQVAIEYAARRVGIDGDPEVIYPEPERVSLLDLFLQHTTSSLQQYLHQAESAQLHMLWKANN